MMRLGDELWLFPLTLKSKTRGNFGEFALYGTLVAELALDLSTQTLGNVV